MLRYILRRTLYMIPTVFGVILLTFFLFNIAGGDPSAIKLGPHATPESLEAYDQPRGFDKPQFFGLWAKTRAYKHESFEDNAGPWTGLDGVVYRPDEHGFIQISSTNDVTVPLSVPLHTNTTYRWTVVYRTKWNGSGGFPRLDIGTSNTTSRSRAFGPGDGTAWHTTYLDFVTPTDRHQGDVRATLRETAGKGLEIQRVTLRRRMDHWWDSQLVFYFKQVARLDFGTSEESNQKVTDMIKEGIGPSLSLTIPMFVIGLLLELALAMMCAFYRNRLIDRLFVLFAVVLMSVNYLVWIQLAQYWLGYRLKWFPVWGYESWRNVMLPVLVGVITGLGAQVRFYRTILLDEMYRDYVRTAEAKGVGRVPILFKHVLKNAMIPVLTSVVMEIPFLYTGSLLLENFFGIPGVGSLSINALNSSDVDVIRAVVFLGAMVFVVTNLITDICYQLVDPRVRLK